ncbi:lipopolysaccharide heptosyltransferase RfaC [Lonepinella sp. BR2474]|uniref:lipopolysaccharide heptosyltransferase RfaC n=1 Tax=Lonepinella sp. BR2474 TaxID=3434548 RepID=UPI003F6DE918
MARICIIKTSSLGDVLHCLPALTDAQHALGDVQFDWVVEENFAEIPAWHSAVNRVIPIAIRRWRKNLLDKQTYQQWQSYKNQLQSTQYGVVIDAQGLIKSALFATRLAQGEKFGYDRKSIREPLASLFYQHTFFIPYQQHAVERIRQLFAQSLGYHLPDSKGDYGIARHFQQQQSATPYMMFIHATTRSDKHWVDSEWKKLAEKITALYPNIEIRLPWGNEKEKQRAEWIAQGLPNVLVLPKSSLTELAHQLANAKAVVSVDTGLAHLTAALDVPNVTLYGATDPKLIGCYGKNQHYLHKDDMTKICAGDVLEQLEMIM